MTMLQASGPSPLRIHPERRKLPEAQLLLLCAAFLAIGLRSRPGSAATVLEAEPNDTCDYPESVACGDTVLGSWGFSGDQDWYSFSVMANDRITVGTDRYPGAASVDTYIELYSGDCSTR